MYLSLNAKRFLDIWPIKSNKDFSANINYRHSHLMRFIKHFSSFFQISRYIIFLVRNIVFLKKLLRHLAIYASRSGINNNFFNRHIVKYTLIIIIEKLVSLASVVAQIENRAKLPLLLSH